MLKNFSVKILLKYSLDSVEIFEESVIIVKLNRIDEIKEKIEMYIQSLNNESEDEKVLELVSIIDYYELHNNISIDNDFVDVYSRYLSHEEIKAYI
ncbi:hypothetical protein [Miniphocaeibacter halophilus]|uniref:Uncharacterized protein n=1 Tax=Miniphocaeibacter halophilus TaxID=2931922 RepID=A0AC61MS08_9FIRM|nr:hypothetical protein [Miniphocaeibacter halophilus]QQK06986.1 hypothetical protein JFY71_06455 [Miniphocaeibacter halophilus]